MKNLKIPHLHLSTILSTFVELKPNSFTMRVSKSYYIPFLFLISLLMVSCYPQDNHDYPKTVNIGRDGGVHYIDGIEIMSVWIIDDHSNNISESIEYEDSIVQKAQWLTVVTYPDSRGLKIIAEPMTGNEKKRELRLEYSWGDSWGMTKVIQK